MTAKQVLIVDDDKGFRFALKKALTRLGYDVIQAASGEEALPLLMATPAPDVALLDLRMKGMGGLEILRRRGTSSVPIIVLTGHGSVEAAVEAMRLGAFSFLEKPVDAEELAPLMRSAVRETLVESPIPSSLPPLVGTSTATKEVAEFIQTVGPTPETVMIFGETGTGKEVVAQHLHHASGRDGAFVAMNVACVPRDLFESQLFGHRKGAFTGAIRDQEGLFREAHGGTLFLDELGELPIELQAKLLRAIETRIIRGVGESREHAVDVRIIAATNHDLWQDVQDGRFREDLFFRLQVFPIALAPLRERREDIGQLATHLLTRLGSRDLTLSSGALEVMREYDWPGNVRELLNVLRRTSLFTKGDVIEEPMVTKMMKGSIFGRPSHRVQVRTTPEIPNCESHNLADVERAHIKRVLDAEAQNVTKAAIRLGIDRRTLQRKLRAYGMDSGDA